MSVTVAVLLLPNFQYLYQQFQKIQPIEYISGKIDRDTYLKKHLPEYAAMAYINQYLPEHAKILSIYLAGRSYYLDRPVIFEPRYRRTFFTFMKEQSLPETLSYLQQDKITYFLVRDALLQKKIMDFKKKTEKEKWHAFFYFYTKRIFSAKGYSLYAIKYNVP